MINVDDVDNGNNNCRREKRKKQDSLPGGNSLTRDERKVGRPEPFFAWRGFSILICMLIIFMISLLIIFMMLIDLHFIQTCMFFLSFPCFQRVSMTPELLSDEDSINSYIEWWFKCCFLSSPSRILHVCSSWNSICTSRHRRLVFRYLVARSSTCPWTR